MIFLNEVPPPLPPPFQEFGQRRRAGLAPGMGISYRDYFALCRGEKIVSTQPILVLLGAHSLSVATLVVVSDGVGIWAALRFAYH